MYSKSYNNIFAPNQKDFVSMFEIGDSIGNATTQIYSTFDIGISKGGGTFFIARGANLGITLSWKSNDSIVLKYKQGIKIEKKDTQTRFGKRIATIIYQTN